MPSEPYIGEIFMSGFNFPPRGYANCSGQILSIAQNTALFSLLGTTYGGNGQTTFGLPDLRGRVPINMGQGPGLSNKNLGEMSGTEDVTLLPTQMPQHNHALNAVSQAGDISIPTNAFLANTGSLDKEYRATGTQTAMNVAAIGNTGGSQPHSNMQPYLVVNFYIAIEGLFPSRN
ncbi:MAG: tail fiber protein [Bacteroidota bacterium]